VAVCGFVADVDVVEEFVERGWPDVFSGLGIDIYVVTWTLIGIKYVIRLEA